MHISECLNILENKRPHRLRWVKRNGETVEMEDAVLLSSSAKFRRMNVKSARSGQIRKLYYVTIVECDGEEVYL